MIYFSDRTHVPGMPDATMTRQAARPLQETPQYAAGPYLHAPRFRVPALRAIHSEPKPELPVLLALEGVKVCKVGCHLDLVTELFRRAVVRPVKCVGPLEAS